MLACWNGENLVFGCYKGIWSVTLCWPALTSFYNSWETCFCFLVTNAIFRELQKTLFFTSEFMHVMQFLKVVNTRFSQLFHIYHCRLYFLWLQYYPLSIFNKILRINHICCYFISCSVQGLSWYVLFIRNCLLICLFYKVND